MWERHAPTPALIDLPGDVTPESAAEDVRSWEAQGYRLLSILDRDYPVWLRGVQQAPPVIFTLGTVIADDAAVSVVGSRKASPAGLAMAADIARALTARKLTVIAGLARGIDTAAHQAALDAGGRTVAVIGTGIGRVYPAENRGSPAGDRWSRAGAIAVLAGCAAAEAHVPDAERHDVRLRAGYRGGRGRRDRAGRGLRPGWR